MEFDWYARIRAAKLYVYELPADRFEEVDSIAGYSISRHSVLPQFMTETSNLVDEIVRRGYKLRLLSNLYPLRDEVVLSTVEYSIIRMKNAAPKP